MKVRFLTLAQQEVDEAVVWFDQKVEGKGFAFLDELDRVVRLVQAYPLAATEIEPEIRRFLFARFPYSLIYGIDGNTIVVVAVAHLRRSSLLGRSPQRFRPLNLALLHLRKKFCLRALPIESRMHSLTIAAASIHLLTRAGMHSD